MADISELKYLKRHQTLQQFAVLVVTLGVSTQPIDSYTIVTLIYYILTYLSHKFL